MDYRKFHGLLNIKWHSIPVALAISIVPVIVYPKVVDIPNGYVEYYWTSTPQVDLFSYYKAATVVITAVFGIGVFLADVYNKKLKIRKFVYYIPMGVYVFFTLFSTLFSSNRDMALFGFVGRFEGMFVLLSYMAIMFIAMNIGGDKKYTTLILASLAVSASIIGFLGILQYYNIGPSNFVLDFQGVYTTLGNSNYTGSYMVMLFPLSLALFISIEKPHFKVLAGIFNCLMFANWIGCGSLAGIVGGAVGAVMVLAAYRKEIARHRRYFAAAAFLYVLLFLALRGGDLLQSLPLEKGIMLSDRDVISIEGCIPELKGVNVDEAGITLEMSDGENVLNIGDINQYFQGGFGDNMPLFYDMGEVKFPWVLPRRLYIIVFEAVNSEALNEAVYGPKYGKIVRLNFVLDGNSIKFIDHRHRAVELESVETWGFKGMERVGTNRGYIWSRSLPLLKDTLFLGYGPDTFAMHFPQQDYIGKLLNYAMINKFVDKPHNLYLNTALSTGVPSFLSLSAIFILYFVRNLKSCFKASCMDGCFHLRVAIFAAACGYMVSGFFNDSYVSVAPVFWALLGLGMGLEGTFFGKSRLNKCRKSDRKGDVYNEK